MRNHQLLWGALLLLCCAACKQVFLPQQTAVQTYRIDATASAPEDSAIVALIQPYKIQLEAEMNVVLGEVAQTLNKAKPESSLGNWAADVTHQSCESLYGKSIDFAIVNYGGLRITQIPAGPLRRSKIFELMPFDNQLVVLEANGTVVQQLFERMADYGGWPISHSVSYKIEEGKAKDIKINGLPLTLKKIYRIGMTDFVANGGDKCFFFKDMPRTELAVLYRDALLEFVEAETKAGRKIEAKKEGRVLIGSKN